MDRSLLALLLPGLLAGVGASCAPRAAPAATPASAPGGASAKLDPALESLAFYVGSWRCRGTEYDAGQAAKTWDARVEVRPELDGKWLSVQMIGPGSNRTAEHKGYDAAHQRWVHLAVVNNGSWGMGTSKGWEGSSMTFLDPEDPSAITTFTKINERTYSHGVAEKTDQGPRKVWEKTCSKE